MKREVALKILEDVRESYGQVAAEYSQLKKSALEEFGCLSKYAKIGDKVLDLGCGDGRLVEIFQGKIIEYFGLDNSRQMIEEARQKFPYQEFKVFDGMRIPYPDNFFDKVFCLGVFHHIPGRELRLEFLKEIRRILKKDGKLIIGVRYLWQKRNLGIILKNGFKKLFGRTELDFFDYFEKWFGEGRRFFHNFRRSELKNLIRKTGFKDEEMFVLERRNKNLLAVAKK